MWSAGVAVPISSNVGAAVPSVTPTSTLGHMLDSEITSSCPKEEIDECSSDNADNRAVCARLAQYHQTGTALQSASSSLVKAAKSGVGNCSRQCWVSEESDDLLHSGMYEMWIYLVLTDTQDQHLGSTEHCGHWHTSTVR
jgi:hypothetical protein